MSAEISILPELQGGYRVAYLAAQLLELTANQAIESEYQANHDNLTGALNRNGLEKYLDSAVAPKALLWIDSTNFKAVNDKYGHNFGDKVLIDTLAVLQNGVRPKDVIARWGGDEWVVVLNGEDQSQTSDNFVDNKRRNQIHTQHIEPVKVRIAQQMQIYLAGHPELIEINFNLAVGGTEWPGNMKIKELIEQVDNDMYAQKTRQHENGQYR